jgi:hypothetical protein
MKGLNMSPKVKTVVALIIPVIFGGGGILALLLPNEFTAVVKVILALCMMGGTITAILNVFHVPAPVVDVIAQLLAQLGAAVANVPPAALAKAKKITANAVIALVLLLGTSVVLEQQACLPANTPDVISSAAACAIDVIEDVQQAPTPQLLQQTLVDCGITAADLWADISALMSNAKSADAGGTVTTKRGAAVVSDVYINHLQQWQALQSGGAQ